MLGVGYMDSFLDKILMPCGFFFSICFVVLDPEVDYLKKVHEHLMK